MTDFVPSARLEAGRISGRTAPFLASVILRSETGDEYSGYVFHKVDFAMLWAAFRDQKPVPGTRLGGSDSFRRPPDSTTLGKFLKFYEEIRNIEGTDKVAAHLNIERDLAQHLPQQDREDLFAVLDEVQRQLLGQRGLGDDEEVCLAWRRRNYRTLFSLFKRFLPGMVVMVCRKGAFHFITDRGREPDWGGLDARSSAPLLSQLVMIRPLRWMG